MANKVCLPKLAINVLDLETRHSPIQLVYRDQIISRHRPKMFGVFTNIHIDAKRLTEQVLVIMEHQKKPTIINKINAMEEYNHGAIIVLACLIWLIHDCAVRYG